MSFEAYGVVKTRTMDCSEIQFMVLFVHSFMVESCMKGMGFYCLIWKGGDTMRHKDDAQMDMAVVGSKF